MGVSGTAIAIPDASNCRRSSQAAPRRRSSIGVVVLLSCGAVAGLTRIAAAELLPSFAGETTITNVGSGFVDVVLPTDAQLVEQAVALAPPRQGFPGFAAITASGAYAAIYLVANSELRSPTPSLFATQVDFKPPNGCSPAAPPVFVGWCLPEMHPHTYLAQRVDRDHECPVDECLLLTYPAGSYRVYLLANPGASISATLVFRGLSGRSTVATTSPIVSRFQADRASGPAEARLDSLFNHELHTLGTAIAGFWSMGGSWDDTVSNAVPSAESEAVCLYSGIPSLLDGAECQTGHPLAPPEVGGQPVWPGTRVTAGFASPAMVGTNVVEYTILPVQGLPAGSWSVLSRIERAGSVPSVGTYALWFTAE